MAATHSLEQALEALPAMLNLVLVQTGKILRDPDLHSSQNVSLTRRRVSEFVPPANDRFQDALDEIETEILQAKAMMEKDLSKLRRKRMERDRQLANITTPGSSRNQIEADHNSEKFTIGLDREPLGGEDEGKDAVMADAASHTLDQSREEATTLEPDAVDQEQTITVVDGMPQDSHNTTGLAISIPQDAVSGPQVNGSKEAANASQPDLSPPAAATLPSDVPTNNDFDFDSMFDDAELVAPDGSVDFDIDFSIDEHGTQDLMSNNAVEGVTTSNTDVANALPVTNEDLNSLMPGLESYVNATNDAATNNATANVTAMPEAAQGTTLQTTNNTMQTVTETALGDSSFDDFFNPVDFNALEGRNKVGDPNEEGDFEGFEEFNDDWFKM